MRSRQGVVCALAAIVACLASAAPSAVPAFESRQIFPAGTRGHVHASSLVQTPDGGFLAVWYENGEARPTHYYQGGDRDKSDDVRIGAARLAPGAAAWSAPFVIADTDGVSDNNPVLAIDHRQRLWLFYATLLAVPQRAWESALLQFKVATDASGPGAPRWDREGVIVVRPNGLDAAVAEAAAELRRRAGRAAPRNAERARALLDRLEDPFARRLGWMPRAHPLVLADGALLLPLANENFDLPAVAITRDGGDTWSFSEPMPGLGGIQPSVVPLGDGRLRAYLRDARGARRVLFSDSRDGGLTWSAIAETDRPTPGGGVEALRLANGHLALIHNDGEEGPRDRLAIAISEDDGRTWPWTRRLAAAAGRRFDYPSIVEARDGSLHATFSDDLATIRHVVFDEAWVRDQPR